ncbi:MAG: zinc ribbon domain-containing protein [Ignavibacteriales bacterium]|nr:zinc ribbon domain-containing protein [Ignavibacteriales bacterium]
MICSNCTNDNPRTALECIFCGTRLSTIRCKCGFLNSLMDHYCGNCGSQLIKATALARMQKFETSLGVSTAFSEQELMTLIEIQQSITQSETQQNKVTQGDIDTLFG